MVGAGLELLVLLLVGAESALSRTFLVCAESSFPSPPCRPPYPVVGDDVDAVGHGHKGAAGVDEEGVVVVVEGGDLVLLFLLFHLLSPSYWP